MADRHAETTTTRPGNDAGLQDTSTRQEPVRAEQDKTKSGPASATQRAVAAAQSTAAKMAPKQPPRPTRRARLRLTRIDPWSVMKTSFLLSIAFAVVTVVAVLMVWSVLTAAGVWDSINTAVRDVVGGRSGGYENALRQARTEAFRELEAEAREKGADAVIGIDIDYEVVGKAGSMLMVTVSGTAVSLG